MITPQQMTKAVFILDAARVITATEGQALVWHDLVTNEVPLADNDDLMAAVRKIATKDRTDGRSAWLTVGDLITQIKAERRARIETEERRQRQLESGRSTVTSIDVAQLMRDARSGMEPDEVARRARERAEGGAR